jgi:hypothetical protein
MPVCPHITYQKHGWTNYADFFNYEPAYKFLPFKQARKFVRGLGLKTAGQWKRYRSSGKRPKNIPHDPKAIYGRQFKGLRDWLGVPNEKFLPFNEARRYVQSVKGLSGSNWFEWIRSKRPSNIPSRPDRTYEDKGWKGWRDWFGNYRGNRKEFLPYRKARALARTLDIKSTAEWHLFSKQGKRPKDIPANPNTYYKEFISYPDFLGYKVNRRSRKNKGRRT